MPDGEIKTVDREWMQFAYRESKLKNTEAKDRPIVVRVTFTLTPTDGVAAETRLKEKMKERIMREPKGASAGCFFKNIKLNDQNREHILEKLPIPPEKKALFRSRNAVPCGWLVTELGLKGKQIGGAEVYREHANFIINTGNATADEVMQLVSLIKMRARDELAFQLDDEVQLLGF